MPGQITRRPFTDCPYTWTTTISGISSGSGTVGDRQCRGMNVSGYAMKFRACDSTGDKLVWVGKCFVPPPADCYELSSTNPNGQLMCDVAVSVDIPSFGMTVPAMQLRLEAYPPVARSSSLGLSGYMLTEFTARFEGGSFDLTVREQDLRNTASSQFVTEKIGGCPGRIGYRPSTINTDCPAVYTVQCLKIEKVGTFKDVYLEVDEPLYGDLFAYIYERVIDATTTTPVKVLTEVAIGVSLRLRNMGTLQASTPYVAPFVGGYFVYQTDTTVFRYDTDAADCERSITIPLVGSSSLNFRGANEFPEDSEGFAPPSIQLTAKFSDERNGLEGVVGADAGDRGNATWSLEYDIQEQLWTLHSFERIEHPIYTLADADPCVGLTKILTRVEGSGGNGCEVSPDTVTITRGCPDNLSYRPRDARTRTQCARTSKRKGCDCQNMPIDERWRTINKCGGIGSEGCEDYDADDVKCRYPKNQLTCSFCGDDDIPCTYEALFGGGIVGKTGLCDIIYDDKDIAASTVTLRQRCRFEGPCDWVAVGPTDDKRDGVVGHEPYCMLCSAFSAGTCASDCTWEAIQAGFCPDTGKPGLLNPPINILAKWGVSWVLHVAEPATLTYDHPSFGVLIYTTSEDEPFICDNVNTLYLTAQGNLPDGVMPESICVRPRYSGCGGSMAYDIKSDAYEEVEDQIACCDPACGSIGPIPIKVRCCFSFEECSTTFTAQKTLLGRDSPAGPSYLGSCTLHGVLWTGVIYCDGVRWKTDWYCKSPREFFVTTTHTHTCCPLTLSIEYWPDNFGGVKCCPVQECKCCDTSGSNYDTLEMSITFPADCAQDRLPTACTFSRPVTMTLSMVRSGTYPNHVWTVDPILCDPDYGFDMSLSCGTVTPGEWRLSYNFGGGIPAALCNPNSGTLTATNSALCPAILLEWTNPIVCDNACVLVSNITITS